jgi:predicted 3-demethylubiquinone-9 3-methyltransferase (glyoxalase superfamily)
MQKITPCLWFDMNGEEAMESYASIFKDAKVNKGSRYSKEAAERQGLPEGTLLAATFELAGQKFMALNGGPMFKFTEAISLMIDCKDQEEVDYYWNALTADGGEESMCGWLKDKFGLSWQVTPAVMRDLMSSGTPEQSARVMAAMMTMKKIIIQDLQDAYNGISDK